MSQFYSLRVKNIRRETADCVSIALDVPPHLHDIFAYQAGQYLTFRAQVAGESLRRSYSICSSPHEGEWRVAVKQVPQGKFSSFANQQLKMGVMPLPAAQKT